MYNNFPEAKLYIRQLMSINNCLEMIIGNNIMHFDIDQMNFNIYSERVIKYNGDIDTVSKILKYSGIILPIVLIIYIESFRSIKSNN